MWLWRKGWRDDALLVLNKRDESYKTRNINGQEADKDKETDYPLEHIFLYLNSWLLTKVLKIKIYTLNISIVAGSWK